MKTMKATTAINIRTGKPETVSVDSFGRVPAGYRAETREEIAAGRGAALRAEIAKYDARGDVVLAEQARRTLADARATGVAR